MTQKTEDTNIKYGESFYKIFSGDEGKKIGDFCILTSTEFAENEKIYKGKVILIGTLYIGMGHFIALCYVPTTDNFVFCNEGGSNGYDRDEKYKYIIADSYAPQLYPVAEITDEDVDDIKKYDKSIFEFTDNKKQYTYDSIIKILESVVGNI